MTTTTLTMKNNGAASVDDTRVMKNTSAWKHVVLI